MITVTLHSPLGRDEAEADDPESALLAARTLWDDAAEANPLQGHHRACVLTFAVDGKVVRVLEGVRP